MLIWVEVIQVRVESPAGVAVAAAAQKMEKKQQKKKGC